MSAFLSHDQSWRRYIKLQIGGVHKQTILLSDNE